MRYTVTCTVCKEPIGETNNPREARDMMVNATDHCGKVIGSGLVNIIRYKRANRDR